jgi:transcriptional regulator with XRE-family HTH domain
VPAPLSLGRVLRRLRTAKGMTIAELSAASRVREAYLLAIEDDREEPSATALRRIVHHLEPSDTSYEQLARLLKSPELDPSGEYVDRPELRAQPPRPQETSQASRLGQLPPSDGPITPGVWATKTDVQVVDAAASLSEYTTEGQRAILAELSRRHLTGSQSHVGDPSDPSLPADSALQFDHAVIDAPSQAPAGGVAVACSACQTAINTEYFDVNGHVVCDRCRAEAQRAAETPTGIEPLIVASVLGLGAAVAGALIYYAVIAIAHLQIGYVAILIGYMVGYAVRKGARSRGGRRFQILAVALTYFAICLAYTPIVVTQAVQANRATTRAAAPGGAAATPTANEGPTAPRILLFLLVASLFVLTLPVLVVWGSLPSGLISAFIIFIGLRQSWKMTAAPPIQVLGPFRVGSAATAGFA